MSISRCVPSLTELMAYSVSSLYAFVCARVNFVFLFLVLWWNVLDLHSQAMTNDINYCQHFSNYSSAHLGVPLLMYHIGSIDWFWNGVI